MCFSIAKTTAQDEKLGGILQEEKKKNEQRF